MTYGLQILIARWASDILGLSDQEIFEADN